jgi:hypothetical protein
MNIISFINNDLNMNNFKFKSDLIFNIYKFIFKNVYPYLGILINGTD